MKRALELTFLALLAGLVLLAAQRSFSGLSVQVPGDAITGGRLYDNWVIVLDAPLPQGNQALWENQDFNQRSGIITWRCVECHGWDYKGVDGAYGAFSTHYTGFTGLEDMVGANQEEVIAWLDGTFNEEHDFLSLTNMTALNDIAAFLRTQQINTDLMINASSGASLGNRAEGEDLYLEFCADCHGDTGDKINFGSTAGPLFLGDVAVADPWQTVHKMRFSTATETRMRATEDMNWSLRMVADVLAHLQTLPRGNPNFDILVENRELPVEVENQGQIEPIIWASLTILGVIALNIAWDYYSKRKAGR
ncbi:MAG: hypothetical protein WD740_08405 [Anaerolineales bacterium]